MKPSLKTKALILSLSALVIVGSGCERRGRAPVKNQSAGGSTVTPDASKGAAPGSNESTTPAAPKREVSQKESDLEQDAKMNCEVAAIDEFATPTADSLKADIELLAKYRVCMAQNGIKITDGAQGAASSVDSAPLDKSLPLESQSKAYQVFAKISHDLKDDQKAHDIMNARLELSMIRLQKFITKYGDNKLSEETEVTVAQGKIRLCDLLTQISSSIEALKAARSDFDKLAVFMDGVDQTLDLASSVDSNSSSEEDSKTGTDDLKLDENT